MGIFTDPCPKCGNRVRKGSQFCPKCGEPAPKGLAKCGKCGAEVRTSSTYCWKCGCKLDEMAKPMILADRWARSADDFAVRVDNQIVKGWLSKPLIVEHGTRALFFQDGRFKGELPEGRHEMGGFLNRLNHFMVEQNASVVLMDAGDVSIDLVSTDLWTEDQYEASAEAQFILRVQDPDAMFANLFKGSNQVRLDDLRAELADEVKMTLLSVMSKYGAAELFTEGNLRNQLEGLLQETLTRTLGGIGLEMVQLRSVQFACPAYEKRRKDTAAVRTREDEVDISEQRAALNRRLREIITQDKMDSLKTEKDFENFIRQTEHELHLKDHIRDDEMDRLKERFRHDREATAVRNRIELHTIENDAEREEAWKKLIADEEARDEQLGRQLQRDLDVAKTDAEKSRIKLQIENLEYNERLRQQELAHVQDMKEANDGLDLLDRVKQMEREEDDAEHRRELEKANAARAAELDKLRIQQNMTPEQIIAIAARENPALGSVLVQKYAAEGKIADERAKLLEKQLADERRLHEGYADRQERMVKLSLEQMGMVAGTRARAEENRQTIVTNPLGGAPVVIDPRGVAGKCKHCGGSLEPGGGFCPHCGKGQ